MEQRGTKVVWGGMWAKEWGQPLEAGKGKEMDSPWDPPERNQPYRHLTHRRTESGSILQRAHFLSTERRGQFRKVWQRLEVRGHEALNFTILTTFLKIHLHWSSEDWTDSTCEECSVSPSIHMLLDRLRRSQIHLIQSTVKMQQWSKETGVCEMSYGPAKA